MVSALRLFDWGPSPFCMKVRMILEYKGIEYERVPVLGRPLVDVWRRGKIGKVPAMEIDGELVCDSTDIAYALEERFPTPAILPTDRAQRGRCHALEDWTDESLYFINLYFQWLHRDGAPNVARAFAKVPFARTLVVPFYSRMIARQVRGQGTARKPEAHVRRDLDRHLDAIEGMLTDTPFLLGDAPMLCDFALLSQLHYLSRTPVGEQVLTTRPMINAYRDRMRAFRR